MFKSLFIKIVLATSLLISSVAFAQGPKESLQTSIDSLLVKFIENREVLAASPDKLYAFVENVIDENWDFAKMAQLVMGKNWRRINDEQKTAFVKAFKGLLIRTYSTAIFKYSGKESIKLDEPVYKGKNNTRAVINADGSLGDGSDPIPISFSMFQDKVDKSWRIYNVAVAGVSLVTIYRSSYSQIISNQGIDYLIESLESKSAKAGA